VVPIIGEQFDLGYRLERLGVGRMLTETPLTASRLARELESLLRSERIQERCRELRPLVEPEAGCVGAADVVEEIAGSHGSKPHGFGT
jgi:UDP:flavonoid glycosyltransferase YjiC (YdhE family)